MDRWFSGTLADVCASVDYGFTASASDNPAGPKFLRITDIASGALDWRHVPYAEVSGEFAEKFTLHHRDIVIARTGASTGASQFISSPPNAVFASYLVRLKIKQQHDPRFISYWLKSRAFQNYITGVLGDKSAQPNASASTMVRAPMCIPASIADQQIISCVLGALDDKIEMNRRMNETLEAAARAVFKDWFVDFGPIRAKMEGRAPYLPSELWALFPDTLDDDGKPKGWEFSEIGKEVKAVGGATPSTKNAAYWENGGHYWATPKDMSKLSSPVLLDTERKITDAGVEKISSGLLPAGTVLLSSRAPIGYLAITEVPTAVNQGFIAMICDKKLSNIFVLFWCYEKLDYIKGISGGSTFAEISKKAFRPVPVIVPSEAALSAYKQMVQPLCSRIAESVREITLLSQTRDALLPKLMSGEIRLRDAESAAAKAL